MTNGKKRLSPDKGHILPSQQNELFKILEANGLNAADFEWSLSRLGQLEWGYYKLVHASHGYYFQLGRGPNGYRWKTHPASKEVGSQDGTAAFFGGIVEKYSHWVNLIAGELREPDLWANPTHPGVRLLSAAQNSDYDETDFSGDERVEIRRQLNVFKNLVTAEFDLTKGQISDLDESLSYLSDALDRLNKFDWRKVFASTMYPLAVALSVDTATGNKIFDFVSQAFSELLSLPF